MNHEIHRPKKSLGQHFLIDENIARKIVDSLSLTDQDHVLEIGSGHGMLTKFIVHHVKKLVAVEIDKTLIADLHQKFDGYPNFQLIEGDFLTVPLEVYLSQNEQWKIVGNIPYHITSPIIFKIFKDHRSVASLTLMVQKEVAQRIAAKPNSKAYGIPSVLSQLYADTKILFTVSMNVFKPKPKIDSAVIRWQFLPQTRFELDDEELFLQITKALFGQRRKIIRNSLKHFGVDIEGMDFAFNKRPEQLSVEEIVRLCNLIAYGRKRHKRNC